jgi:hypothetical protein
MNAPGFRQAKETDRQHVNQNTHAPLQRQIAQANCCYCSKTMFALEVIDDR